MELRQALAISTPIAESLPGRMDAIMDFSESGSIVTGWAAGLRGIAPQAARNLEMVIVVTTNPFFLTILRMFRAINPRPKLRLASAPTVAEAVRLIQADRASGIAPATH